MTIATTTLIIIIIIITTSRLFIDDQRVDVVRLVSFLSYQSVDANTASKSLQCNI